MILRSAGQVGLKPLLLGKGGWLEFHLHLCFGSSKSFDSAKLLAQTGAENFRGRLRQPFFTCAYAFWVVQH